ncbi:serine/threonine-protein phosphatase 6 regulatory ankyrin repeat subunit c [Plakobranchus ocellatus]|uniref:Serine/threonine-protein phosphatase 6 regulatory ankyrin repeat subunit c n=1 Tax=Plakobranchus ocellatus TaxID=259542 RepID=A0AAV3YPM4_9GAST|nr:serine/threonine-protein phosphatase 6 regulatory ankyrin repeat subunit c [Plakobranchus ocellatus]
MLFIYHFFHCLAPRNHRENLLAALKDRYLSEVDRLLNLMHPNDHIDYKALCETYRTDMKSCVVNWIISTTILDPETCQTLLRPAIMSGSMETVGALLNRGADLNMPYSYRKSVLEIAMAYLEKTDLMEMIKFLVGKDANVNRGHGDYSPLVAASLNHPDVVSYLLQNGAEVNEVGDNLGNTPLTAALSHSILDNGELRSSTHCRSIVETLLSAGADPNKPKNDGETALHLALDSEITNLLIQAGADLEARDDCGQTPLLVAACTHRTDVINVLKFELT